MESTEPIVGFSNLTGRPAGPFVSAAARIFPGVRAVQDEVPRYAEAWGGANRAALAADGPLWVALGDSMTQGIGASRYDRGWVGQLADQFAKDGRPYRVVNLSQSGARVDDVLDVQLPVLESLRPDLVTVLIGSNDIFSRSRRKTVPRRYADLLRRLPRGTVVANLPQDRGAAGEINRLLARAVTARGLVLADTHQSRTTSWKGKLARDHFHPNDAGYAGIAAVFARAIDGTR